MSDLARHLIQQARDTNATYLDLGRCSLTPDSIPPELFELTQLETLILSDKWLDYEKEEWLHSQNVGFVNQLSYLPEAVGQLTNLKILVIGGGYNDRWSISDLGPIQGLTSLTYLDCSYNHLSTLEPIQGLTSLTSLNCRYNLLSSLESIQELTSLTWLNCSSNHLISLAPIQGFISLTYLDCSSNYLRSLEPIQELTGLTHLDCSYNHLSTLEPIQGLTSLAFLNCRYNQFISSAPIQGLTSLTYLDCSSNKLSALEPIQGLTNLTYLDCSSNHLISLAPIQGLTSLTSLDCSSNQLSSLDSIQELTSLTSLNCSYNPLTYPPVEVVDQGFAAIRAYFKAIQKASIVLNNEVKLILLGNSTAGKSSFSQWLQTGDISQHQNSTHGMVVTGWKPSFPIRKLTDVVVKILDFGGQEFYHDTHHLFLTKNAFYVLIWDGRYNRHGYQPTRIMLQNKAQEVELDHFPIEYWLSCIAHFTKPTTATESTQLDTPTLVLQNKIDEPANGRQFLNQKSLTERFPFVTDFAAVSLLENQRTQVLNSLVKEFFQQQPVVGQELPDYWLTIRENLLANEDKTMTYSQFAALSRTTRQDMSDDEVCTLCLFLRNTFYLQCFFVNETAPQPDELIIHDPNWLVECIYTVLNTEVSNRRGELDDAHIQQSLAAICPEEKEWSFVRNLLLSFKLIFPKTAQTPSIYIAPHYLPEQPNEYVELFIKDYQSFFQFRYGGFLHRRVILELFAAFAENLPPKFIIWKYGMVLIDGNTQLLIRFDRNNNQIDLLQPGNQTQSSSFLQTVLAKIRSVNRTYQTTEWLTSDSQLFIPLAEVKQAAEERRTELKYEEKRFRLADFQDFMPYLGLNQEVQFFNQRLFISYSKYDKHHREELETHLSGLRREGYVDVWHDGLLEPGKEWDPQIKEQLKTADLILLLVSAKFIQTDYTWEIELREALQRHHKGEVKVIPIIVEYCDWENLPSLSSLAALPEKGKPVESEHWYNRSQAWTAVIKKLRELILKSSS